MAFRVIVYEDAGWQRLLPLVYVRATFQLLCGTSDLVSRVKRLVDERPPAHFSSGQASDFEIWCRPLLAEVVAGQTALATNQPLNSRSLLLNGRGVWHSIPAMAAEDAAWVGTVASSDDIACIWADETIARQLTNEVLLDELQTRAILAGLPRRDVTNHVTLLEWPWHFVHANLDMLHRDWKNDMAGVAGAVAEGSYLVNGEGIHIGWGTKIKPCVVIDADDGPVWIGENVTILPHSYIQGPAYIGNGTLIQPGAIVHAVHSGHRYAREFDAPIGNENEIKSEVQLPIFIARSYCFGNGARNYNTQSS